MSALKLFNSLGRRLQEFVPLEEGRVKLYSCGLTVYDYAHLGNLRAYVFVDTLRRALSFLGYKVCHVMNITDVGHLVSDADEGQDKMALGAERERKSALEIARFYEEAFFADLGALNVLMPNVVGRATDYIPQMTDLIGRLKEAGYAYVSEGNVYFGVERFGAYNELRGGAGGQKVARVETDTHKEHPDDFVLWFTRHKYGTHEMVWDSPWGKGFPGWHTECAAIARHHLGDRIDIHTGGVDHIPIHHTNEKAQAEAPLGHRWVNYWLHNEFLLMGDAKMSKSEGGFVRLEDLTDGGFSPLHFRYFLLGAHYRQQLRMTREALEAAKTGYERMALQARGLGAQRGGTHEPSLKAFTEAVKADLNTPQALAAAWGLLRNRSLPDSVKRATLERMDSVLGLSLLEGKHEEGAGLPKELMALIRQREEARAAKDFALSDRLRQELLARGVVVRDTERGSEWERVGAGDDS